MSRKKSVLVRSVWLSIAIMVFIGASIFFVLTGINIPKNISGHAIASSTATQAVSPTPQLLFTDNFSSSNDWYVGNAEGYTRALSSKGLQLSDTNHQVLVESLPTNIYFDNFVLTTTFTLLQASPADSVGLYLRGDVNLDHDYRINIFGDNSYSISKETLDKQRNPETTVLVPPTPTLLLRHLGQPNMLKITMNGPMLIMEINGQLAASISDPDYTQGQVALFVSNGATSPGVTALFSNVTISALPAVGQP